MKSQKRKARRPRKTVLLNVWLPPDQKQALRQLADRTGLDQSKLVRRALGLLFNAFKHGQLELGFPESVKAESTLSARNLTL